MRTIKLLDGTAYEVDRCGADGARLRIRIVPPFSVASAASDFTDPAKTSRIEHQVDGHETDHCFFDGYTVFDCMAMDGPNLLIILLRGDT